MSQLLCNIKQNPFLLFNDHPNQYYEQLNTSLINGNKELEDINIDANFIIKDTFFSSRNIDLIQKWVKKDIEKRTNILIPNQKIEHIFPVMIGIYDTYSQNLPFALKEQIYELDNKVVTHLSKSIIIELKSRSKYYETINSIGYIEQPICINSRGQRTLPSTLSTI